MTRAICMLDVGARELDLVDHADDRRVHRALFVTVGHSGRRAANNDDPLVKTGAHGIDGNDIAALVGAVEVDRLYDEKLFAMQAFVFLCGDDGAEDACDDHASSRFKVQSSKSMPAQ